MTVLDIGCGMGFFSLGMARLVGAAGKVISLDIQPKMLRVLERRARRRKLLYRIETRLIPPEGLGLEEPADFALCFWMVHETPDPAAFFVDLRSCLKPGARILVSEPNMHVAQEELEETIRLAGKAGFREEDRPDIKLCRAVVLVRQN
jgi:2-polyprenyl-3-methyl-5-hydroxy-6-metoxy-1,4-benzoquinol methylase